MQCHLIGLVGVERLAQVFRRQRMLRLDGTKNSSFVHTRMFPERCQLLCLRLVRRRHLWLCI